MTSKNLCFKLMREDLKRRVWTVTWCILSMVFTVVVPIALRCSDFASRQQYYTVSTRASRIENIISHLQINPLMIAAMIVSAFLWAMSGFHYLHNRQKVDFYHCLPVKRSQLFLAVYLNGILVPLVFYVLAQAAAVGFVLSAGISLESVGMGPWQSVLLNSAYYCLLYTTVVVAMMMTGHVVVALLGSFVFFGYGPALVALYVCYCDAYFHTFIYTYTTISSWEDMIYRLVCYTSPFANYMKALIDFDGGEWSVWRSVCVLLVTAALALVSYGLYRLRASEAAGKAMAFEKTKMPIRLLIAIPVGVAAGLFFGYIGGSLGWLVFGSICGALLTHYLMEIIYHFDFRKLFANRYQLVLCTVAVLLLNIAGYYDLYGYDSWHPKADQIVDAALYGPYDDDWIAYGDVAENSYNGYYQWRYMDSDDYRMSHMKLTDAYTVSELVRQAAEWQKATRFDSTGSGYRQMYLRVKLKSGREVYRRYSFVETKENKELLSAIQDSTAYKKGIYPVLNQTAEETAEVYFLQNRIYKLLPEMLDDGERAALLEAFQQDMAELTTEERRTELPIGTIQFRTVQMKEAYEYNRRRKEETGDTDDYTSSMEGRCYYPVYPSFSRTLALLEKAGAELTAFSEENIAGIDIYYYGNYDVIQKDAAVSDEIGVAATYYYGDADTAREAADAAQIALAAGYPVSEAFYGGTVKYEDAEDIRALLPGLLNSEYYYMNNDYFDSSNLTSNMNITVRLKKNDAWQKGRPANEGRWTDEISCVIDLSKLSPETVEKYCLE